MSDQNAQIKSAPWVLYLITAIGFALLCLCGYALYNGSNRLVTQTEKLYRDISLIERQQILNESVLDGFPQPKATKWLQNAKAIQQLERNSADASARLTIENFLENNAVEKADSAKVQSAINQYHQQLKTTVLTLEKDAATQASFLERRTLLLFLAMLLLLVLVFGGAVSPLFFKVRKQLSKLHANQSNLGASNNELAEMNSELLVAEQQLERALEQREVLQSRLKEQHSELEGQLSAIGHTMGQLEFDRSDTFTGLNQLAAEILDVEEDQVLGMPVQAIFPQQEAFGQGHIKQVWQGEPYSNEVLAKTVNGATRYVMLSLTPVKNLQGNYHKVLAFIIDISQEKSKQLELALHQKALNNNILLAEFNLSGEVISANTLLTAKLNYLSTSDLIGLEHDQIMPDAFTAREKARFWKNLINRKSFEGSFQRKMRDGRLLWLRGNYQVVSDLEGKEHKVLLTAQDITNLKEAEEELAMAKDNAENLYEITASESTTVSGQLEEALRQAAIYLRMEVGLLAEVHDDSYTVFEIYAPTLELEKGLNVPFSSSYCKVTYNSYEEVLAVSIAELSFDQAHPLYPHIKASSYIGIPIYVQGEKFGVLNFSSSYNRSESFTESEISFLKLLGVWFSSTLSRYFNERHLMDMSLIANQINSGVLLLDKKLRTRWMNSSIVKLTAYSEEELLMVNPLEVLKKGKFGETDMGEVYNQLTKHSSSSTEIQLYHKLGLPIWMLLQVTPVQNEKGLLDRYIVLLTDISEQKNVEERVRQAYDKIQTQKQILEQSTEVLDQKNQQLSERTTMLQDLSDQLAKQNKSTTDSIKYASRIQTAIFEPADRFAGALGEAFVFFSPRDLVSGDFYWAHQEGAKWVVVVADCTGHGVPGAFMSIIGNTLLNRIVQVQKQTSPSAILSAMHDGVVDALHSESSQSRDGMDVVVCTIDTDQDTLMYGGAMNPLYYVDRNKEMQKLKGTKLPIGGQRSEKQEDVSFEEHLIPLHEVKQLYLCTDGFQDQFGGPEERKYMRGRMAKLFHSISDLSQNQQLDVISREFFAWRGEHKQTDDVLVLGLNPHALPTAEVATKIVAEEYH